MKLELKHIAPYLPYGLNFQYTSVDTNFKEKIYTEVLAGVRKDVSSSDKLEIMLASHGWVFSENEDSYKPVLRPLSDLKKDNMGRMSNRLQYSIGFDGEFFTIDDTILSASEIPALCWLYLVENHFDVFGLIEKGLVIDINTLDKLTNKE